MARLLVLQSSRTYATRANAIKAVEKIYGPSLLTGKSPDDLDYFIHTGEDGRFFPVFVGERALYKGAQFHFSVIN